MSEDSAATIGTVISPAAVSSDSSYYFTPVPSGYSFTTLFSHSLSPATVDASEHPAPGTAVRTIFVLLYAIIFLGGLVGNGLVIFVVSRLERETSFLFDKRIELFKILLEIPRDFK